MYELIASELVDLEPEKRFIGARTRCRFCGDEERSAFGGKKHAHTFPEALGNKQLFSLDECRSCNGKFSIYEDALCKAVGPFLSLGGVKGKKGVRQTGRSDGEFIIQHRHRGVQRHVSVKAQKPSGDFVEIDPRTGIAKIRIPVQGDKFVPRYAFKALLKIAISLLPEEELVHFSGVVESLQSRDIVPAVEPLQVGFSFSYIGNAPPVLAGMLYRRTDASVAKPYLISIFVAGSVCFQIWVRSDGRDEHVPKIGRLGCRYTSKFPLPEGGYLSIRYSDPLQFDWSSLHPELQPFEAFDLAFNTLTKEGVYTPIPRGS
jgi:hypothetical protein